MKCFNRTVRLLSLILFVFPSTVPAATYYVDAVSGNDSDSGLTQGSAWRTASKINSSSLAPGDTILFKRGQTFSGDLESSENGTAGAPITFSSFGSGNPPVLARVTIRGDYYTVENLTIDHKKVANDAVRIRDGKNVIFRNLEVKNGTNDGIDADDADDLLIENCHVHHFLNGSFSNQADAHGITATGSQRVTIRNTEVHHVSGDSFQADPRREPGNITNTILIEDSHFWTSPLASNFNNGWLAGQRPGENAVDTKVSISGWENASRVTITLRNMVVHGWEKDSFIANKAVFNMKEKITAVFDGITVYDAEIAFRLRGARGNADTTLRNVVIYNVETAIRAEDNLANLVIHNTTFGDGINKMLQLAGGSGGTGSWDWRNNAFVGSKPSIANHSTNLIAPINDFQNSGQNDYHLISDATLIDQGTTIGSVLTDRDSNPRSGIYDVGAYELFSVVDETPPVAPTGLNAMEIGN